MLSIWLLSYLHIGIALPPHLLKLPTIGVDFPNPKTQVDARTLNPKPESQDLELQRSIPYNCSLNLE